MARMIDLHLHSELSDDSRAPVEAYLKWLARKRDERPLDGIVLTEHRQFDSHSDYRALEDKYGMLILKASEVETEYGHVLVYGVNDDMLKRFDFSNVRLRAQELIDEVAGMGGVSDTTFDVYEQSFPAGTVVLGGNHETATGKSMYTVAVIPTTP